CMSASHPPLAHPHSPHALRSSSSTQSFESFNEHAPLLGKPAPQQQASNTSLSSSTLSLFLASIIVNTGSVSNGKNPLGSIGSKLIGAIRPNSVQTIEGINSMCFLC